MKNSALEKSTCKVIHSASDDILNHLYAVEVNAHVAPWTFDCIVECFCPEVQVCAIYVKNEIVGFSALRVVVGEAEIYTIGILKAYQGQGLGTKLLEFALEESRKLGALDCFLEVRVSNISAIKLYEHFGFEKIGLRKNYYAMTSTTPCEDAYTMHLKMAK